MISMSGLTGLMQIKTTRLFNRQVKKLAKKHFPVKVLKPCVRGIVDHDEVVLRRIKDHALQGRWKGYREFHPSRYGNYGHSYDGWVVVYRLDLDELVLLLVATGSHEILDK
ncbi:RelE/StbE family addiction module toxin [Scardovia inopinata]|uniref:RelE/StbE family addiction module toxin n=2 Tax=Scardovia inopinata TaxID=78259 RepID=W5IGS2_SCAIO|nr:type II toxin-antitoxin system mRNA interferase toxin, RelE/StbE family [Scardovia inopinata]EFG26026.2 RelE/StbE family addiction module toxin [Scardovia inopinata F0304]SUV51419.1 RelE/StbE family addiction module toxin [Scardovia inopinata]